MMLRGYTAQDTGSVERVTPTGRSGEVMAGRFVVRGMLGRGGMGDVYEAEHVELGRRFAVKFLREEHTPNPASVALFEREARAIAKLESDHVVAIVDHGVAGDGTPFFVMERLQGTDVRSLLKQTGPLSVPRAVRLVVDACYGVRAAHGAGLVHRDLKPSNLFVTRSDRGQEVCKVLDFGVAKHVSSESIRQGALIGTASYMAPEQLRDSARVDARTDIYALGAILYECLTGRPPFDGNAVERVFYAILHESPRSVNEHDVFVPARLEQVVLRALARAPEQRFASVDLLIEALAPFAGPPSSPGLSPAEASDVTMDTHAPAAGGERERPHAITRRRGAPTFAYGLVLGVGLSGALVAAPWDPRTHDHRGAPELATTTTAASDGSSSPSSCVAPLPAGSTSAGRAVAAPERPQLVGSTNAFRSRATTALTRRVGSSSTAPASLPAAQLANAFDDVSPYEAAQHRSDP
jgi:serine/threonine protein kinase